MVCDRWGALFVWCCVGPMHAWRRGLTELRSCVAQGSGRGSRTRLAERGRCGGPAMFGGHSTVMHLSLGCALGRGDREVVF